MKQKITLEIDNDTGVEFEEFIERRKVMPGEYWLNEHRVVGPAEKGSEYYGLRYVLTPKVDHELEQAKKLIGKWVIFKTGDVILKVKTIRRDKWSNKIVFQAEYSSNEPVDFYLEGFHPFPLPVWRCFDSDKPERSGYYYLRSKDRQYKKLAEYNPAHNWYGLGKATNYEWLDEGER